jgi:hypothetical protein
MEIRFDHVGKIVEGRETGNFVKFINDAKSTGGFLILVASDPNMQSGFDDWVEDLASLQEYVAQSRWIVEWQ